MTPISFVGCLDKKQNSKSTVSVRTHLVFFLLQSLLWLCPSLSLSLSLSFSVFGLNNLNASVGVSLSILRSLSFLNNKWCSGGGGSVDFFFFFFFSIFDSRENGV